MQKLDRLDMFFFTELHHIFRYKSDVKVRVKSKAFCVVVFTHMNMFAFYRTVWSCVHKIYGEHYQHTVTLYVELSSENKK